MTKSQAAGSSAPCHLHFGLIPSFVIRHFMSWPGFTNPWMLAALAAAGLPVLIHYLTRARPRRVVFPPFKFLVEAGAGQQSLHRLRTFLLLALRCLAVLALVLLFARPFLKPTGAAGAAEAGRRVVLVVDASLSMRAVQNGTPLFARAQVEAADVLPSLESGTEAAIVLIGAKPRALLPALSRNIPALHDELVKAQPTYEAADPAAALALAKKILGGPGTIYVFSDFQQSNWKTVNELPAGIVCRLRAVTTEPVENVALTAIRLAPAEPVIGEPVEVLCTVFNSSPRPRQETVRLELGELTQEARVSVPPFASVDAAFNVSFTRLGSFTGKATLPPDDLREDNTRFIATRVHKAMQLLLVSDADTGDRRSAAFFVTRALAPSAQAAPGLTITRRHSQDTDRGVLETSGGFIIVAPAVLPGEVLEVIARRVSEGAPLLVLLDGPTSPALAAGSFTPPFRLIAPVSSPAGDVLVPGVRKLFSDADSGDWSALRFRRHYQNEVLKDRGQEVLLSYPDGSAALTLTTVGQGAVVFANLPLTPDGGDLLGSPMFPALLHELLRTVRRGADERAVAPGSAWTLDAPTSGETPVAMSDPEGRPVVAQVMSSGRATRLALPAATAPGAYLAKQGEVLVAAAVINIDPRESDTRPIALEKLKPGTGSSIAVVKNDEELLLAGQTRPLWPQLALAAVIFFSLEMLLLAFWRTRSSRREEALIKKSAIDHIHLAPAPAREMEARR